MEMLYDKVEKLIATLTEQRARDILVCDDTAQKVEKVAAYSSKVWMRIDNLLVRVERVEGYVRQHNSMVVDRPLPPQRERSVFKEIM